MACRPQERLRRASPPCGGCVLGGEAARGRERVATWSARRYARVSVSRRFMSTPTERVPPSLATELARQYDIVRILGRGGMGVVWLARERSLDRLVAIKVLSGPDIGVGNVRERFRREARIAARLVHPNIVPLHAFGETPDALYFAMGYVEGESLATRLEREGRLSRPAAQRILAEIADALAFAHREGVVHRDVKPENILLDGRTGRAMLADFGIARIEDAASTSVTMTGVAVGTPSYMSPEQAVGAREIDGRSDLYSLGVVGYRMLLGRLPFVAASGQALMAQHATVKPDDLTLAVPPADRGIASVVMRALEKDPAARWANADDFRDELQSLARDGSALPEELQRVQMIGTKVLYADVAIVGIFGLSAIWDPLWLPRFGDGSLDPWLLFLANLAFLPVLSLAWAFPTARKFGWRDTLRAMLHPPESWAHWWPRSWRRADDLWDRLPKPLRRLRNVLDGVVTFLVLDIAAFLVVATTGGGAYGDWLLSQLRTGNGLAFLGVAKAAIPLGWLGFEFFRARKKLGVSARDLAELLALPHLLTHPAWSKPKFARLLASETSDAPSPRPPQTLDELARAIKELTSRLVRMGFLLDDESVGAAESVHAAIDALESEIQLLHARFDPAEQDRLAARVAALGSSDDDAELRPLLEGQQAVLRRLEQRRHDKEARRDRLRDQLRTLWMQLIEMDARLARGAAADPELTGRVQALSRDLARGGDALSEVERLIAPAERETVSSQG
ncbi:MAG: serine/threonine-protein kinase [Gemmatimonadaceae bacterium]